MANVSGGELAIVIRAVDMASPTLAAIQGQLAGLKSTVAAFNAEVSAMTKAVGLFTTALGVGAVAAVDAAVDMYAEFETSTIELAKKTGLAQDDLNELIAVLTRLSTTLPTTRKEMVDLAVEAAKLGITGTENIAAVVQAALKFREATSGAVSATNALTALGKILTAMDLPWEQVENLGSAIVKLADVSAADVPEILEELQKVAAIGSTMGLTPDQVAAMVTQIIAFGHVAGRTGLRLSRIIQLMMQNSEKVVEVVASTEKDVGLLDRLTELGYGEIAEKLAAHPFLQVVSDIKEFNRVLQETPITLIMQMADFFAQIPTRAEKIRALTEIFGSMAPYFLPLVDGMQNFTQYLEEANRAFQEGTELTRQYELALSTLNTQQKIISGNFETAVQQIGEGLAPAIKVFNEQVLGPFSQLLVEITQQWAAMRKEVAETSQQVPSLVLQIAKVRLEGIAEAIQKALLEGDYKPMLEELSIVVGGVVLAVQAWKLAAEALVALKAFFKTAIGGLVWDIGTCVLTANFVFEMLPESVKKAIDEATDKAAEFVEKLPLPEGLKRAIQGFLDRLGEEKWTTVITFAITWFIAKEAWHLLMMTIFGLFSSGGLTAAEGGAGTIVVKGLSTVIHGAVDIIWSIAKTVGTTLIEAVKDVLWAAGFSATTGGLAVAGALLTVGAVIGLAVTAIVKLARMNTEEFEEAIATESMRAVDRARQQAEEAIRQATESISQYAKDQMSTLQAEIAALAPPDLLSTVKTQTEGTYQYVLGGTATRAGEEAARYLAMQLRQVAHGTKDAAAAFAVFWADLARAAEQGDSLANVLATVFTGLNQFGAISQTLSDVTLEQLQEAIFQTIGYLQTLPEEKRIELGLDDVTFNTLIARLTMVNDYINALPPEVRIKVVTDVSGPILIGIQDIWAQLKRQRGGIVPGIGRGDIVPAMLEPGEFVVPRWMMRIPWLRALLIGIWSRGKGYQEGGLVEEVCPVLAAASEEAAREAEEIERERLQLERRLYELLGEVEKVREIEIQEIHEVNRELQRQIWALEDAQEVERERAELQRRLWELEGNTAAIRAAELEKLHESNRALQEQIWALEDSKKAAEETAQSLREIGEAWVAAIRTLGGTGWGDLAETAFLAFSGDFVSAALNLLRLFVDTGEKGLETLNLAAQEAAGWLETLSGRARELVDQFLNLIASSKYLVQIQRGWGDLQGLLIDAILGFLAPIAAVISVVAGTLEDESEEIEEATEQTRKSLASLNVPTGYKLERAAWGVARPGEPWREEEETERATDKFRTLLQDVPNWLREIIENFHGAIEEASRGIRDFIKGLQEVWASLAPAIIENLLPVLEYFGQGLLGVLELVKGTLVPALEEFLGPIIQNFGKALADLTVVLLSMIAAVLANVILPILDTLGQAFAALAAWVRGTLLPDFIALTEGFRALWQDQIAPFLQSQVFPKIAEWGLALYSWICDTLIPFLQNTLWPFLRDRLWPAFQDIIENKLIPTLSRIWATIEQHWPQIEDWIVNSLGAFLDSLIGKIDLATAWILNETGNTWAALRVIWESQSLSLWDKLLASAGIVLANFNLLAAAIGGLIGLAFGPLGAVIGAVVGGLAGLIPGLNAFLNGLVQTVASFFLSLLGALVNILGQAANLIYQPIRWVINAFIAIINGVINLLNWALGWLGVNIPNLPYLQSGGLITREGVAYLHAGELVVPAQVAQAQYGYGGTVINIGEVHLHGVEDPEEFMEKLERYVRYKNLRATGNRLGRPALAGA